LLIDSREAAMAGDGLFKELPEQSELRTGAVAEGVPRLREPRRDQIELRAVDIESLIGQDYPVRVIWSYVEGLDLSALEDRIKARGDRPGHPATSAVVGAVAGGGKRGRWQRTRPGAAVREP
jgi:hypothetical protein